MRLKPHWPLEFRASRMGHWVPALVSWVLWLLAGWALVQAVLAYRNVASWQPVSVSVAAGLSSVSDGVSAVARALGSRQMAQAVPTNGSNPVASPSSHYALQGVLASASSRWGAVLIKANDQPAKVYELGDVVDAQWRVHRIHARQVVLQAVGQGGGGSAQPATLDLSLPPLPDLLNPP